jgi:predicted enzyme related to lactoylglutathione lyase
MLLAYDKLLPRRFQLPSIDNHSLGAPCWFELSTTDQAAAKQFYTQLFGWTVFDNPMGPGQFYTIFKLKGHDVGAAYTLSPNVLEQGVPPHWNVYFAAPNIDESATKAVQLGGTLVQPPFDVMDLGRMTIAKDPGDAVFFMWQEKRPRGEGVFGEENAVCWVELMTWDAAKAREFYTGLFGWEAKVHPTVNVYTEFGVAGKFCGGILAMDDQMKGIPSHWGIYILVADCDATVAKAKELGATVRHGPVEAPGVGRFASLVDPQGASFSVIKPSPM